MAGKDYGFLLFSTRDFFLAIKASYNPKQGAKRPQKFLRICQLSVTSCYLR